MSDLATLVTAWGGAPAAAVLLTLARLSGLLLVVSPIGAALPAFARAALCLVLALCLARVPSSGLDPLVSDVWRLAGAGVSEFGLGAIFALGINMGFAVFTGAGRLLDIQVGFGIGQVLDPITRQQMPVLTGLFRQLALVAFFSTTAFASCLVAFAQGLDVVPVGASWMPGAAVAAAVRSMGGMFTLGLALAAPVVVALMLVDFALGVVSRNLPQMNMFALGVPIKVLVGTAALAVWIGSAGVMVEKAFALGLQTWAGVMR